MNKTKLVISNKFVIFFILLLRKVGGSESFITCSVEEYVMAGLEFDKCQNLALDNMSVGDDPCPILHDMAETCATSIKHCFSEKGYLRGLKILFDSMALNFPDAKSCNVLKDLQGADLDKLNEGEKCTIAQEITVTREISQCDNSIQMSMISNLTHVAADQPNLDGEETHQLHGNQGVVAFICDVMKKIRSQCMEPKLLKCYEGRDYEAHLAYLLESLKITGKVIGMHLIQGGDIEDCAVFDEVSYYKPDSSKVPLIISLSLCAALLVFVMLFLVSVKLRMGPRLKAWMSNKPYNDFPDRSNGSKDSETQNETAMERRSSESEEQQNNA